MRPGQLWDIPISSHSSVESYWPALRVLYPKVLSTSGPMSSSSWKGTNSDFGRLTEKGLLIRTGRGRYKLYHPLFREFLRQTK